MPLLVLHSLTSRKDGGQVYVSSHYNTLQNNQPILLHSSMSLLLLLFLKSIITISLFLLELFQNQKDIVATT